MSIGTTVANEHIVVLSDDADVGEGARRAWARGEKWSPSGRCAALRSAVVLLIVAPVPTRAQHAGRWYTDSTDVSPATWGLIASTRETCLQ
jgi:hypothetical protein